MLPRPLHIIDKDFLLSLPTHGPSESKRIEYKSRFRDDNDKVKGIDKDTFRKDVTQFANTEGGDLIIGVQEKGGLPTAVPGVELDGSSSPHAIKEMLDQLLLEIQPRLSGHTIVHLEVTPDRFVFIVRVPQSFRAPHSIGTGKGFFYRTNSGRDAMNIDQVRDAFLNNAGLETQLQEFRASRVELVGRYPPFPLEDGLVVVLHILPVVGASRRRILDVIRDKTVLLSGGLPGLSINTTGINFEGCFCTHAYTSKAGGGYAQWFRNGFREAVWVFPPQRVLRGELDGPLVLDEIELGRRIVGDVRQTINVLAQLEVPAPYYIAISILKCINHELGYFHQMHGRVIPHRGTRALAQGQLDLMEVLIDSEEADVAAELKHAFDQLANAFGMETSENYDEQGTWRDQLS